MIRCKVREFHNGHAFEFEGYLVSLVPVDGTVRAVVAIGEPKSAELGLQAVSLSSVHIVRQRIQLMHGVKSAPTEEVQEPCSK